MTGNPDIRTVVVTGAAGFIGSHLCEALLPRGLRVIGFDNFDSFYDPAVKRGNVSDCIVNPDFALVEGDIRDAEAVDRVLSGAEWKVLEGADAADSTLTPALSLGGRGGKSGSATDTAGGPGRRPRADVKDATCVDAVVHLAARAGVRPSIENPLLYQDVNIGGTSVLLEAMRRHGIRRFIFGSSSSVYGNNRKVPFSEDDSVDHPISPYAATKKAGELLCHTYHHLFEMDVTCLRFFTVYGARQRPDLAIHKFTRLIEAGQPIPVFGDGGMMRDHTYVDDIVAGVTAAMDRCEGYHVYNLGNSRPVSLSDLVTAIEHALGKKAIIHRQPRQPGDVDQTYADVSRARAELGFEPRTPLEEGLKKFVAWFRENRR